MADLNADSLAYHSRGPSGKIAVVPTKPCATQGDLSMAYTPGVAAPCLAIKADPGAQWRHTARGNLVAVVTDGTAVLGLGDIGPEAGMPVMEGKAVLFKRFAGIDAFPVCLGSVRGPDGRTDPAKVIETVQRLEPTFGGINLEDIAAPACFEIESRLKELMGIPVFHDDQHGTAIISLAALLNSLGLAGKSLAQARIVVNGAGAAGISCAELYVAAGADRSRIILCDSKGVVHGGRADLNDHKRRFTSHGSRARRLSEALEGADVFVGVSVAGALAPEMVARMAPRAIVFAMANPTPEIFPADALAAGAFVVGTGRSDFPNQVNNALGFPGIFRGALDTRARGISRGMMLAAARALASLPLQPIPPDVRRLLDAAYPSDSKAGVFDGEPPLKPTYVIPKPFDPRVVPAVARFVAEAAAAEGLARTPPSDFDAYQEAVAARVAASNAF